MPLEGLEHCEQLSLFLNLYHVMLLHAYFLLGPPGSPLRCVHTSYGRLCIFLFLYFCLHISTPPSPPHPLTLSAGRTRVFFLLGGNLTQRLPRKRVCVSVGYSEARLCRLAVVMCGRCLGRSEAFAQGECEGRTHSNPCHPGAVHAPLYTYALRP